MIELSDADILARLTNFEDAFVERKSTGDTKDLLKTAVAFANSTPIGYPAILFYGVTDKGVPEGKETNLASLQKTISDRLAEAYPTVYYFTKVLQQGGKQFLAVIIPGSEDRPHFAGKSYIRDGSQTLPASEQQFDRLIAERNSKAREILKWCGKEITVTWPRIPPSEREIPYIAGGERSIRTVIDCNQFFVTVEGPDERICQSFSLTQLDIGFDNEGNRLELMLRRR